MARAFLRSFSGTDLVNDPDQRLAYLIIASTVPAALIGFLFEDFFESTVRSPWVVVFNFVLVGVLFIVGEAVGTRTREGVEAGVRGGRGDRVRAGGGAGARRLAFWGDDHARALPGLAARGGGPVLVPDERADHRGRRQPEGRARWSPKGWTRAQALLFVVGFVTSAAVGYVTIRFLLNYLDGPQPARLRLLPLRGRRRGRRSCFCLAWGAFDTGRALLVLCSHHALRVHGTAAIYRGGAPPLLTRGRAPPEPGPR